MEKPLTVDNIIGALLESLVGPVLAKLRPFGGAKIAEEDMPKQMEAVAWLYNYYVCQDLPTFLAIDWEEMCKKAALLQPKLSKFMGSTKSSVPQSLTLTEQKVKSACDAATDLKNRSVKNLAITKVCVCLLSFRRDKCVLACGTPTMGGWSFIENKKDNRSDGLVLSDEDFAFRTVQEQTGMTADVLHVEHSLVVVDDLNQVGGSTRFFIMTCLGTFDLSPAIKLEEISWVPLDTIFSKATKPLIEIVGSSMQIVDAVHYFRLRPFCSSLQNWLRQHELGILEQGQETMKACNGATVPVASNGRADDKELALDQEQVDLLRPNMTTNSAVLNTPQLTTPNGSPHSLAEKKSGVDDSVIKDGGGLLASLPPPKEQEEEKKRHAQAMDSGMGVSADTNVSKTTIAIEAITAAAVDTNMAAGGNSRLAAPDGSPKSSTRVKKREEEQFPDKAEAILTMKRAYGNFKKKRKALSKELLECMTQMDTLYEQISDCDTDLAKLMEGGKAGWQLALQLSSSANGEKQTPSSDVCIDHSRRGDPALTVSKAVVPSHTETNKKKRPFVMLKSSMQELNEICTRNKWPLPSYWVVTVKSNQRHNEYNGKVRIRCNDFELTESGEPSDTAIRAKLSAASYMLSALHRMRARNGTF